MVGFFDRMLGRNRDESSANKAKERLKFVLVHDRINLPPEQLKMMKEEILQVISKYVSIAGDNVDIALEQHDRNDNRLIAEVPFSRRIDLEDVEDEAEQNLFNDHNYETRPNRNINPETYDDGAIDDSEAT